MPPSQHSQHHHNSAHPQSHPKLHQQHSLPLQLQYQQHQPFVTTTQPSPAGTFISQSSIVTSAGSGVGIGGMRISANSNDISPLSSSNSFSSVDTNQTLLNSIANQTQQQSAVLPIPLPPPPPSSNSASAAVPNRTAASNRSYRTKYSQFMIITPAVSIDRDYEHDEMLVGGVAVATDNDLDDAYCNGNGNGNIFRMSLLQSSSIDSGNSSDNSFRSNYNPYLHNSRQHLLPKGAPHFYTFSSWRWCTLICAAMRCFGGGHSSNAPYSTSFARPPYQRSRSSGANTGTSSQPHRRLRSSSFTAETAFEHFSAPFKPRKTRDHLNNITYEL